MANFKRVGFGQVEPNQLSGQKTGQIYASLPLKKEVKVLQNGEFMYYDYNSNTVTGECTNAALMEPMLVFNEIKIYEDLLALKDFAMIRVGDNYVTNQAAIGRITSANVDGTTYGDGALTKGANISVTYKDADDETVTFDGHTEYGYRMDGIAPRLIKTNIGDVMTTNMVKTGVEYNVGDLLTPKASTNDYNGTEKTLVLEKIDSSAAASANMVWQVAKVYTMPDGNDGLKIQRIK